MDIGMIGLGRMGANMALRLLRGGHRVVGFDRELAARASLEANGAESAESAAALVARLPQPRTVWLMVPAGDITDATLASLLPLLEAGASVVDGAMRNVDARASSVGTSENPHTSPMTANVTPIR